MLAQVGKIDKHGQQVVTNNDVDSVIGDMQTTKKLDELVEGVKSNEEDLDDINDERT